MLPLDRQIQGEVDLATPALRAAQVSKPSKLRIVAICTD
jgi:hypothetical protein